ncbi:hypothetical protein BVX97_02695 [bacterium E08(2017)]|nr:hypothetical protein BVX97_02695 [bacterium E08(2017)]
MNYMKTSIIFVVSLACALVIVGCKEKVFQDVLFYHPPSGKSSKRVPAYAKDIYEKGDARQLAIAIASGEIQRVRELLDENKHLVNVRGKYDITPLWFAVKKEDSEIVGLLLKNGANPNIKTEWVKPIMVTACMLDDNQILSQLLSKGGDPNTFVEATSDFHIAPSCLSAAANSRDKERVGMLLDAGADINRKDLSGSTVLMGQSVGSINLDMIIYLLEKGADPTIRDNRGRTVVDHMDYYSAKGDSWKSKRQPIYEWLVEHGYNLDELRRKEHLY